MTGEYVLASFRSPQANESFCFPASHTFARATSATAPEHHTATAQCPSGACR